MPTDALAVANYFLELAEQDGKRIDPLKLQKLVYLAHGWNLALTGKPLVNEDVEAWPYGPVIPVIYHEFKRFGSKDITEKAYRPLINVPYKLPDEYAPLVKRVWESYRKYTGMMLANKTHEAGTPWATVWGKKQSAGSKISNDKIKSHYEALANKASQGH